MSSEVEKLYSLAAVNKIGIKRCSGIKQGICQHNCNECESFDYKYPPFTAEKQIELIKWLLNSFDIGLSKLGQRIDTSLDGINCISGLGSADIFEDSLCMAIIDLWQDLTEAERNEIREILK